MPQSESCLFPTDEIETRLLRQQQIRLGLLKAARVLFSQQENLQQIMAHPLGDTEHQYSLFQQLLSAATRPSPIKAIFSRDEFEVHCYIKVGCLFLPSPSILSAFSAAVTIVCALCRLVHYVCVCTCVCVCV